MYEYCEGAKPEGKDDCIDALAYAMRICEEIFDEAWNKNWKEKTPDSLSRLCTTKLNSAMQDIGFVLDGLRDAGE